MAKRHNEEVYRNLKPGDLVEFKRDSFSHWGVCVGNKKIVHLTANDVQSGMFVCFPSGSSVPATAPAEVRKDDFWSVAQQDKAYVNNSSDRNWRPLSAEEIVKRAESKIGRAEYNLFSHNCEHFANWCRYGKVVSKQVDEAKSTAATKVASLTVAGVFAVILFRLVGKVST